MRKVGYLVIFAVGILIGCSGNTRNLDGYQVRSVTVNGKTFGYRIFVPKDRDPGMKLPVMLYLHGSGTRGADNQAQADAFNLAIESVKGKVDFIVVLPQCGEDKAWISEEMSNYALAALDDSIKEFNGDAERIYLAGFSLGAHGVWKIAGSNPGKFSALMPVAGRVIPYENAQRADSYANVAKALGSTPVWIFHGAKDDAVPVDFARKIVNALEETGNTNVKYTEYADEGHLIFSKAFAEPGFLEWLRNQSLRGSVKVQTSSDENRDFVDFSSAISGIVYDEESPFREDAGDWLSIVRQTVTPNTDFLLNERAIADDLRANFILVNKEPSQLRPSGYDVKFAHDIFEAKGARSVEEVFADRKRANSRLRAIVRLSNIGRYSLTSLIYIEYYSPKKGLLKFYCLTDSKITWFPVT